MGTESQHSSETTQTIFQTLLQFHPLLKFPCLCFHFILFFPHLLLSIYFNFHQSSTLKDIPHNLPLRSFSRSSLFSWYFSMSFLRYSVKVAICFCRFSMISRLALLNLILSCTSNCDEYFFMFFLMSCGWQGMWLF